MYNYYVAEKRKKQEEEKKKIEHKENQFKEKRKKMLSDLCDKYDNRVRNFIMDMVQSPIKVKEFIHPIENPRLEFFQEEDVKIKGRRGFIFKGFKTEKERIAEHLKNVNYAFGNSKNKKSGQTNRSLSPKRTKSFNDSKNNDITTGIENSTSPIARNSIIQPQMRYKPRTDLERIYDSINTNSFGKANKKVVDKQLKELDLNIAKKNPSWKKPNEEFDEIFDFKSILTKNKEETEENEKIKNSAKKERKKDLNILAKNLMSDLHNKTHFKGTSVIANKIDEILKYKGQVPKRNLSPRELEDKIFSKILDEANNDLNLSSHSANMYNKDRGRAEYKKNFNPLNSSKENSLHNSTSLNKLHCLAFATRDRRSLIAEPDLNEFSKKVTFVEDLKKSLKPKRHKRQSAMRHSEANLFNSVGEVVDDSAKRDEDRVVIDDQHIPRNRLDLIASKILNRCNVNHNKNKNNNKLLRSGDGKLMMTNGMTIAEFENKYNL